MAAGENPKGVYGPRDQTPSTRMGNIWVARNLLAQAQTLKAQQDQWDCIAASQPQSNPRPFSSSLEPLVALLRDQVKLFVHCYKIVDFEAIIRLQDEFGITISAFHHALEAYKVPSFFASRNITISTFADMWGYKMEAFESSVRAPKILTDANVKVSLKSDHPVIFAKWLSYEAVKAYHYGLSEELALRALTRVPAETIGLDNRIGTLEKGKDADVVIWNAHPLTLGAAPLKVFIEGVAVYDTPIPIDPPSVLPLVRNTSLSDDVGVVQVPSYAIRGASLVWVMTSADPVVNANIVVDNGIISCVGTEATCPIPNGLPNVYDVSGLDLTVTPGLISADGSVGLWNVDAEEADHDGFQMTESIPMVRAADGLRLDNRHISAAWAGGVTSIITPPMSSSLIGGTSVAFYTVGDTATDAIIRPVTALHINIGNIVKNAGGQSSTISGQIADLRAAFKGSIQSASVEVRCLVVLRCIHDLGFRTPFTWL
eukprot:TRINITY_DN5954_c0_g1_i3.p1 TRINITY_DN5954_c0_g1~~TRINITY_DN5954_c0_g1_i3.p1  ORF type:complete len:485 (-),score=92.16 TRINITY_DN5954_c0_g1_i3:437-1891(-)